MTLEKLYDMGLIEDDTEIFVFVRDENMNLIACGNWYQDNVLDHMRDEIKCFTWQDNKKIHIDVIDTIFTPEELARVGTEEERRHLIECAKDNSKIDERYMQIMKKYELWEGDK